MLDSLGDANKRSWCGVGHFFGWVAQSRLNTAVSFFLCNRTLYMVIVYGICKNMYVMYIMCCL
jgi:hypothetical protein